MTSSIKKNADVLLDESDGGYFVTPGKVVSVKEFEKNERQALTDEKIRVQDDLSNTNAALNKILVQSNEIINRARAEAADTIEDAKRQGFEKGYEEGLNISYAEQTNKSIEEKQPIIDSLSLLLQKLSQYYNKTESGGRNLDKGFELAEYIIKAELAKNDDAFFGLYKKAAMHVSNVDTATLTAGPKSIAAVMADKKKYESAIEGLYDLKAAVSGNDEGKCVLETPLGTIDTSVSSQLIRAKNIIMPHK